MEETEMPDAAEPAQIPPAQEDSPEETSSALSVTAESGEPTAALPLADLDMVSTVLVADSASDLDSSEETRHQLKAIIEAAIYITDEPLTAEQIAAAVTAPLDQVKEILAELTRDYARPERGLAIRELANGYKMGTKPEHHEAIRQFVRKLQPLLKLSLPALETLAVVAYKQPITAPEIMEIRGVQGAGVLKTLLDRKLIATAGRKDVIGKPIMYKTTKEFLIQFGLSSLRELPTLKEFEELGRMALTDESEFAPPIPPAESPVLAEPVNTPPGDTAQPSNINSATEETNAADHAEPQQTATEEQKIEIGSDA